MSTADDIREAEQAAAAHLMTQALLTLSAAVANAEDDPTPAALGMPTEHLADAIGVIQDLRSRLQLVERDLVVVLGQREGKTVGELSDGRQFKLERSSDRKEWVHDDWKRDVRRNITAGMVDRYRIVEEGLLDTATSELTTLPQVLQIALTEAQAVHGAQAPKSTALKALNLYASDYCTSTPAGWRFTAVKPTTKEDTTNDDA